MKHAKHMPATPEVAWDTPSHDARAISHATTTNNVTIVESPFRWDAAYVQAHKRAQGSLRSFADSECRSPRHTHAFKLESSQTFLERVRKSLSL
jgi:hypothetical protein